MPFVHFAFFLSGFAAILYQLIWQRVLLGIYGANIESVTVVVTAFMIGLGAGSLAGGRIAGRVGARAPSVFAAMELALGIFGLLSIRLFHWTGSVTASVGAAGLWTVTLALLLVPTALMGATLPVLTAFVTRRSRNLGASVAGLYAVNTLGSAAGALVGVLVIVGRLGQQGSVAAAAVLNLTAAAIVAVAGRRVQPAARAAAAGDGRAPANRRGSIWILLALGSGFVALSYEIVWYRAYSIALMARAQAFGVLLGGYLAGIGIGAAIAGWISRQVPSREALVRWLGWVLVAGSLVAFLLVPVFAWFVTVPGPWTIAPVLVAVASCALGIVFPLTVHASAPAPERAGSRTAELYGANIAGSALGSLVTGFWLMDHAGIAAITTGLALATAVMGATCLLGKPQAPRRGRVLLPLMGLAVVAGVVLTSRTMLFERVYDRLMFRADYRSGKYFAEVVENRSGVIGVTADEGVYGSGVVDGAYNTDLHHAQVNLIHQAYAMGLFHPNPRRVLMIGLSSGSWTAVVANHPSVESVTVVEINPGYVGLLASRPVVSQLPRDPRVRLVIDDGRRWLQRHGDERFDVIVANATYHWRANASSLLSVEFLNLVRRHLLPGGVYYVNTTNEPRVQRTAAIVFPSAWRVYGMMAVSDTPITPDLDRFRDQLDGYRLYGTVCLDSASAADRNLRDLIVRDMGADLEPRDQILARTKDFALVTDDNMGTEWRR